MLPNVRSYVQEKYSQGRNGAFPDMGSLPRMTPLTLPHVWLPFVGELLDHPVFTERVKSKRHTVKVQRNFFLIKRKLVSNIFANSLQLKSSWLLFS